MLEAIGELGLQAIEIVKEQSPRVKSAKHISGDLKPQQTSALNFSIKDSNFEAYAIDGELVSKIDKLKASKEQIKDYKLKAGKALTFNIAISNEKEKRTNNNIGCT